jgi:hypothetical protein
MHQPIAPRWPNASTSAMLLFLSFLFATTTTDAFGIMHRQAHVAVPQTQQQQQQQQQHRSHSLSSLSSLLLATRGMGMGMGMGMASTPKKGKEESTSSGGGGMGKSSNDKNKKKAKKGGGPTTKNNSNNFDAKASLMRLEKRFDELQRESAKQLAGDQDDEDDDEEQEDPRWASDTPASDAAAVAAAAAAENAKLFSEYIVAVRGAGAAGSSSSSSAVADWIPVGHLCVSRPMTSLTFTENDDALSATIREAAISSFCRELSYVASLGAKIFSTVARNELQYSVEPMDSFYKFVYEAVVKGSSGDKKKDQEEASSMTKAQARAMLDLQEGGEYDKAEIKQAYRKLSFQYHPDRLGTDGLVDGASSNSNNSTTATLTLAPPTTKTFALIKLAYETLSSGIRGAQGISWYESLGGKDRMEFCGPVPLLPRDAAQETLERHNVSCGLVGLDPAIVQSFVARNLRSV